MSRNPLLVQTGQDVNMNRIANKRRIYKVSVSGRQSVNWPAEQSSPATKRTLQLLAYENYNKNI